MNYLYLKGKFWDFFTYLMEKYTSEDELKHLFDTFALKILEQEKVEYLDDVLDYIKGNDKKFNKIQESLKKNSLLLVYACNRDNFELVKVLVSYGCHFYTSHNLRILHKVKLSSI